LPTELALTTLLNELAEASSQVWLVLDDYLAAPRLSRRRA
jgi:ATP/maltotriose-dependent transcriptional regulator MalT